MIHLSTTDYKKHLRKSDDSIADGYCVYSTTANDTESFDPIEYPIMILHHGKDIIYKDEELYEKYKGTNTNQLCLLQYKDEEKQFVAEKYFECLL